MIHHRDGTVRIAIGVAYLDQVRGRNHTYRKISLKHAEHMIETLRRAFKRCRTGVCCPENRSLF